MPDGGLDAWPPIGWPSITGITRLRSLDHRNCREQATGIWQRSYR